LPASALPEKAVPRWTASPHRGRVQVQVPGGSDTTDRGPGGPGAVGGRRAERPDRHGPAVRRRHGDVPVRVRSYDPRPVQRLAGALLRGQRPRHVLLEAHPQAGQARRDRGPGRLLQDPPVVPGRA